MSMVVTALCDQPEAFALDRGDEQSHYLFSFCTLSVKTDDTLHFREAFDGLFIVIRLMLTMKSVLQL